MMISPCWLCSMILLTLVMLVKMEHHDGKGRRDLFLLIRLVPRNENQLQFLNYIKNKRNRDGLKIHFWKDPRGISEHVDIWVSRSSYEKFLRNTRTVRLPSRVILSDVIKHLDQPLSMEGVEDYDNFYQNANTILQEALRLAAAHEELVSVTKMGVSGEGRPIHVVRIHKDISENKPIVFVLCGSHSREWLAIAACQYLLRKLIFDKEYDEEIKTLLEHHDIEIVPLLNPDGYEYSIRRKRMWRKSRSSTTEKNCRGADLNRNFEYRWGGSGSSRDPCSNIYCGKKPFSEIESLSLARYLYKIRRNLKSFLDVHTYGQLWLTPWGYTPARPRTYVLQEEALREIQRNIKEKNGINYKVGTAYKTLYQTTGSALDWVYGRLGVTHSYGTELRPGIGSRNAFRIDEKFIIPTGNDLLVGLKSLVSAITYEGRLSKL